MHIYLGHIIYPHLSPSQSSKVRKCQLQRCSYQR